MKGLQGIAIAAALGIVGAVCNWFYIARQAEGLDKVSFVIVKPDVQLNPGDRFREEHFDRVDIPRRWVGNLEQVAVAWDDRAVPVGFTAKRSYQGGEILLQQDLRTPPRRDLSEMLAENEALRWVPVDPRGFVPEHVNPGDHVSFIVPQVTATSAGSVDGVTGAAAVPESTQIIGPFEVLALGTRKGRREFMDGQRSSPAQENLIGIRVTLKDGTLDPKSQRLFEVLRLTENRGVQVMLHSARYSKSK